MKTKALMAVMAIASLLLLGGSAFAEPDTIDNVPAATLLLPYFEVDLNADNGTTTLFSVNNASAAATVAHITIWSDLTVPVLDWNVFLTGYDVHPVNMRDVLNGDLIPATLHAALDVNDDVSPHHANPDWDSFPDNPAAPAFGGCNANLPLGAGALNNSLVAYVQNALTGQAATPPGGATLCYGVDHGDNIAKGYVTIDDASDCNLLFPSDPNYFTGGNATNDNQLWGDYFIVDPANNFAAGDNLVHIEAYEPPIQPAGQAYTFYGRYVGWLGTDNREPLANAWATRYLNGGVFDGGTQLLVWRDSRNSINAFPCGTTPFPFPLNETQVVAFDEEEDAETLCFDPGGGNVSPPVGDNDPACFPWETQRVTVGQGDLTPSWNFGWMYLNLDFTIAGGFPDPAAQAHVTSLHSALGLFQVGYQATPLWNAVDGPAPVIVGNGIIPVNVDD